MKKIIAVIMVTAICFSFVSCGGDSGDMRNISSAYPDEDTTITENLIDTPEIMESTVIDTDNLTDKSPMVVTGKPDSAAKSGFAPLPKVTYKANDPDNTSGFSTKKISHSHGPASGGKAHYTVVEFQKNMEKYSAFTFDTSGEKVLYLTFDCGYEYDNLTSRVLDILKEKDVTATFFCTLDHIKNETDLIARMIKEGHIVGNHSATHPSFASISREKMAKEIQETENYLRENFGYAAKYFRFPAGEYNESALELVSDLGYRSVFWSVAYDDWDTTKVRGKEYAIDKVMSRLHPGAVILLHSVSRDNADALGEIIDKARDEGYRFESIVNYK